MLREILGQKLRADIRTTMGIVSLLIAILFFLSAKYRLTVYLWLWGFFIAFIGLYFLREAFFFRNIELLYSMDSILDDLKEIVTTRFSNEDKYQILLESIDLAKTTVQKACMKYIVEGVSERSLNPLLKTLENEMLEIKKEFENPDFDVIRLNDISNEILLIAKRIHTTVFV